MKTLTKNLKPLITGIAFALVLLISFSVNAQNPTNSQNPYDYVGQIHNELLVTYKMKYDNSKKKSVREIYVRFNNLLRDNSTAKKSNVKNQPLSEENINILENGTSHFKNDFKILIQGLNISETAKSEISALKDYIFKTCLKEKVGFEGFYIYSVNNEERILNSKRLTTSEKELILGAYSTARHSYAYWSINNETLEKRRGFWGVLAIIGGDVAGWFATGSLDGAGVASTLVSDAIDGK